jgi:hypothetical protein
VVSTLFPRFLPPPQHDARYFHDYAQAKEDRANPYVFRGKKHQQAAKDKQ